MNRFACLILTLLLTACGNSLDDKPPAPLEPTNATKGFYCGMTLAEHPGPKGQLHVAGETAPLWFSSIRDALAYLQLEGATRRIRAFYVHDMGRADWQAPQAGTWIDATKAFFVLGSRREGGMGGAEVVPFADHAPAEAFTAAYGGRVLDYAAIRKEEMFPVQGEVTTR
ncbi:MAG: nitrous oxide reductase accessory protein NosL [Magnetococcales bacterium]|nr:nitrous oxide reductase accessory protein NosL [Magnetococcales bacterium]